MAARRSNWISAGRSGAASATTRITWLHDCQLGSATALHLIQATIVLVPAIGTAYHQAARGAANLEGYVFRDPARAPSSARQRVIEDGLPHPGSSMTAGASRRSRLQRRPPHRP